MIGHAELKQKEVREKPMKSERDGINPVAKPSGTGCVECLAEGAWWFHLRRCAECGHIGCCDSSPNQHASKHYAATGHPIITSFEPSERWFYAIALKNPSPARSFPLLTAVRWINRRRDRPERCLQTGKRCFANRGRFFCSAPRQGQITRPRPKDPTVRDSAPQEGAGAKRPKKGSR
jgi:Zn-finger in ubiquitin-hydrolases and other protein